MLSLKWLSLLLGLSMWTKSSLEGFGSIGFRFGSAIIGFVSFLVAKVIIWGNFRRE
jgi:hypothetical protein